MLISPPLLAALLPYMSPPRASPEKIRSWMHARTHCTPSGVTRVPRQMRHRSRSRVTACTHSREEDEAERFEEKEEEEEEEEEEEKEERNDADDNK